MERLNTPLSVQSEEEMTSRSKSIAFGVLTIGGMELDCYVLDNGKRVLSQRGILGVLSGRKAGDLKAYLNKLPEKYCGLTADASIEFDSPTGTAIGRDAMLLVDLCAA